MEPKEKSDPCRMVLHLMDKDWSYEDALKTVLEKFPSVSREDLETELNHYV